jgi:hypothetical protein
MKYTTISDGDAYIALGFALLLSPNDLVREGFWKIYREADDPESRLKALLRAMLDGLDYGNWPNL